MKLGYVELLGQKHPMCFSYTAMAELEEHFGSLEAMEEQLGAEKLSIYVPAVNALLETLMRAGRIYASAIGEELPPPLTCKVVDVISLEDKREIITAYRTITGHSKREVEVAAKKQEATQAAEQLRGCITTAAAQD